MRIDLQEQYQTRLMKIKLIVQYVTICTRLSGTYRVPFPPLTVSFLNNLKLLEILDISALPLTMDCWRSFNYIEKVYVHTLMVLGIMVFLKPRAILSLGMMPARLVQALVLRLAYTRFTVDILGCSDSTLALTPSNYARVMRGAALTFVNGCTYYVVKVGDERIRLAASAEDAKSGITFRFNRHHISARFDVQQPRAMVYWLHNLCMWCIARLQKLTIFRKTSDLMHNGSKKVTAMNMIVRQVSKHIHSSSQENEESVGSNPLLDEEHAALAVQRAWRCMNPRVLRARHNIQTLREKLLPYVQKSKGLTSEDLFLLFTYAVYTGVCDTCFLYFDCAEYEDGEIYLMADPAIQCTDADYQGSVWYVILMSVLLPFGIPCYYSYALYCNRDVVNPRLKTILKDKNYVQAFACAGVSFRDSDGEMLQGQALLKAQQSTIREWKAANPALYKSLEGKDYAAQFQQKLEQAGFKKARQWISIRARDASIPARRFKFLWGPYR
jgi:hypothetical protein